MSFCSRADSRATVEPAWQGSSTTFETGLTYWKYNFDVLGFHPNIRLKTSTYELTDRIHQNKQGFEGKKLRAKWEGIRRVSIREYVW